MSKHTPGPWHAGKNRGIEVFIWNKNANVCVAAVEGSDVLCSVQAANAHLIAAAPDLLAACEAAKEVCTDQEVFDLLGAAIAKAKGHQ